MLLFLNSENKSCTIIFYNLRKIFKKYKRMERNFCVSLVSNKLMRSGLCDLVTVIIGEGRLYLHLNW